MCSLSRVEKFHPTRAILLSSRDGAPGAIVGEAAATPVLLSSSAFSKVFGCRRKISLRVRLLSPLTETGLAIHGLDARSHRRAQSLHPLAMAVGIALLRYWFQPRPAVVVLTVDPENASSPCSG